MSCDYDVYCIDCDDAHGFRDANHEDRLMAGLCKLGPQIAAVAPLMRAIDAIEGAIYIDAHLHLQHDRYPIDFAWFEVHGNHRLLVRDEYGRCTDECAEYYQCETCAHRKCCRRTKGHDGGHSDKRDESP